MDFVVKLVGAKVISQDRVAESLVERGPALPSFKIGKATACQGVHATAVFLLENDVPCLCDVTLHSLFLPLM